MAQAELDTLIGRLRVRSEQGFISSIVPAVEDSHPEDHNLGADSSPAACDYSETKVLRQALFELEAWLEGRSQVFSIPLLSRGSTFQKAIWSYLQTIPFGQVISYGALAQAMNTHPLAVGQACARNPLLIVVPCHRIVRKYGLSPHGLGQSSQLGTSQLDARKLGGYRAGLAIKKWLLEHESRASRTSRNGQ